MKEYAEYSEAENRPFTAHLRSCDELIGRLRRVYNDLTFDWKQFMQMAEDGPWEGEVGGRAEYPWLEEITDQQWLVIETLVALHEMHLEVAQEQREQEQEENLEALRLRRRLRAA